MAKRGPKQQVAGFVRDLLPFVNHMDPETIRTVYVGLARKILLDFRKKGYSYLPAIGTFNVSAPRKANFKSKTTGRMVTNSSVMITFKAAPALQYYASNTAKHG